MNPISFKRHRFPSDVIRHAVWLYFRFSLSFRDVEELLAQRGIDASYETIRCWTIKFGPQIARRLNSHRPGPSPGAVRQTLKGLRQSRLKSLSGMIVREVAFVQTSPVSA